MYTFSIAFCTIAGLLGPAYVTQRIQQQPGRRVERNLPFVGRTKQLENSNQSTTRESLSHPEVSPSPTTVAPFRHVRRFDSSTREMPEQRKRLALNLLVLGNVHFSDRVLHDRWFARSGLRHRIAANYCFSSLGSFEDSNLTDRSCFHDGLFNMETF